MYITACDFERSVEWVTTIKITVNVQVHVLAYKHILAHLLPRGAIP